MNAKWIRENDNYNFAPIIEKYKKFTKEELKIENERLKKIVVERAKRAKKKANKLP